jgi:hypothetical protein
MAAEGATVRQTRIFVPPAAPYDEDHWAETLLGRVVVKLAGDPALEWWWFSRYVQRSDEDTADCDFASLPASIFWPDALHRSLRLRYAIAADDQALFEAAAQTAVNDAGAFVTDFRDYAVVADLGSRRFLGGDASEVPPEQRAAHVVAFLHATSVLAVDCLVGPDVLGRFRFESEEVEGGSPFRVPLHLFWNMTQVPVEVAGDQVRL